jgi:glycosyltransferase involved in cell wall biosynthesis
MNVIFIGSLYPREREDEIKLNSKHGVDNASNNFQWALIEGLDNFCPDLKIVTLPAIRTYPLKYKKWDFKKSVFCHKHGTMDYCLGFINIVLVKHLSKYFTLRKKIIEITDSEEETIIIIYGVHSPYLKVINDIKRLRPKLKTCLIVPDLPQYMSESRNPIYRFLKSIDSIIINEYLKKIDSFVLLSDFMQDILKVGKRPWIRIEGIFKLDQNVNNVEKEIFKTILYTGNIDKRYGIKNLLKAFGLIKESNYRLWIRGNGNTKQVVINASKLDSRIKYFDEMPRNELINLQKKATVLINPIPTNQKFTKYFFPSKTMDYMASGTPTITTKLKSIPDEYFNYLYIAEKEDAEGLKDAIHKICRKDQSELNEFGIKASKFIIENKNPISQVKKIYLMLNTFDFKI